MVRHRYISFLIVCLILLLFSYSNYDYRYIDDYKLFLHNDSWLGLLQNYKWGMSRIVGNYFFGLIYFFQSNILLNLVVFFAHGLNAYILFYLIKHKTLSNTAALLSALWFFSFPITSEAFLWGIAGQVVFATTFFLLMIYMYLRATVLKANSMSLIVILYLLSITFYETYILSSFYIFLYLFFKRKEKLLAVLLVLTSSAYLFLLKISVNLFGGTRTASLKTSPIELTYESILTRVQVIFHDIIAIFITNIPFQLVENFFKQNHLISNIHFSYVIALLIFIACTTLIFRKQETTSKNLYQIILIAVLIFISVFTLLIIPRNYFRDLRIFYPLSITYCLIIFVLQQKIKPMFLLRVFQVGLSLTICFQLLMIKIEQYHYHRLYEMDNPIINQMSKYAKNNKKIIFYIPGYSSSLTLDAQMELFRYPQASFDHGTHMLHAFSVIFTRIPYTTFGSLDEMSEFLAIKNQNDYVIFDFPNHSFTTFQKIAESKINFFNLTRLNYNQYTIKNFNKWGFKKEVGLIMNQTYFPAIYMHPPYLQPGYLDIRFVSNDKNCRFSYQAISELRVNNKLDLIDKNLIGQLDGVNLQVHLNEVHLQTVELNHHQSKLSIQNIVFQLSKKDNTLSFKIDALKNVNYDGIYLLNPKIQCW